MHRRFGEAVQRREGRRRSLQRRLLRRLGRGVVGRDVGCGGGYRVHRAQSACLAFRWKSSALRPSACVTRGAQGGGIMIGAAGACDGSAGSKYSLVSSAAEAPRCSCAAASSPTPRARRSRATEPRVLFSLRPSARRVLRALAREPVPLCAAGLAVASPHFGGPRPRQRSPRLPTRSPPRTRPRTRPRSRPCRRASRQGAC